MLKNLLTVLSFLISFGTMAQAKSKPAGPTPTVLLSAFMESGLTFDPADPATPKPADFIVKGLKKGYTPFQMEAAIRKDSETLYKFAIEKSGEHDGLTNLTYSPVTNFEMEYKPLAQGNYSCDLYVDRKKIFTFPFTITVVKNDIAGATVPEFRLIDGYWSKYGYFSFTKDGKMTWNMFLTSLNPAPVADLKQQKDYKVEAQLFYEGKPITDVSKQYVWCQRGKWMPATFSFKNKALAVGRKQMITEGHYTLKVKVNQEEREYAFEVKNGKIIPVPEQDKAKTRNTAKFFEGMGSEIWIKRSK